MHVAALKRAGAEQKVGSVARSYRIWKLKIRAFGFHVGTAFTVRGHFDPT
jgi:hypothetical protein